MKPSSDGKDHSPRFDSLKKVESELLPLGRLACTLWHSTMVRKHKDIRRHVNIVLSQVLQASNAHVAGEKC